MVIIGISNCGRRVVAMMDYNDTIKIKESILINGSKYHLAKWEYIEKTPYSCHVRFYLKDKTDVSMRYCELQLD